jgi:hypothetical protein
MNQLVPIRPPVLPALVVAAGGRARIRFLEFFTAKIRNPHTRRAYYRAAEEFLAWCANVESCPLPLIIIVLVRHIFCLSVDRSAVAS